MSRVSRSSGSRPRRPRLRCGRTNWSTQEPALVHKSVLGVGVSPDGKWAATASKDGTARLFDLATGKEKATVKTSGGWATSVAFSPDSKTLAVASDQGVKLLEVATAKELAAIKVQVGRNGGVAFSPDGKTLAIGSGSSKVVRRWDLAAGMELAAPSGAHPVRVGRRLQPRRQDAGVGQQ